MNKYRVQAHRQLIAQAQRVLRVCGTQYYFVPNFQIVMETHISTQTGSLILVAVREMCGLSLSQTK